MDPIIFLFILVLASYLYIAGTYTYRVLKYARMPAHLRWELYPLPHDEGKSYLEETDWSTKERNKDLLKDVLFIVKDYLTFFQYFKLNRAYWVVLYMWHVGFYLIVAFHGLVAIGAIAMIAGADISAESSNIGVLMLHYLTLVVGVAGFGLGCLGSIGVMIKRLVDRDLNLFASLKNYFSYIFYFFVFLSGLIAWAVYDPTFAVYRDFYYGVFTFSTVHVDPALVAHAVLFAMFLFYMPSTQAMHYATKFFAYFAVRWNDAPNLRGGKAEKKIEALLGQAVTWSAPHIQTGKTWAEVATSDVESEVKEK
jgi:nitrate reductase gamma subunit